MAFLSADFPCLCMNISMLKIYIGFISVIFKTCSGLAVLFLSKRTCLSAAVEVEILDQQLASAAVLKEPVVRPSVGTSTPSPFQKPRFWRALPFWSRRGKYQSPTSRLTLIDNYHKHPHNSHVVQRYPPYTSTQLKSGV